MTKPTLAELDKLEWPGPVDWHRWTPTEKKRETERIIGRIFDAIKAENREPDLWERFHLAQAINLSNLGWHEVAHADARFALIPRDKTPRLFGLRSCAFAAQLSSRTRYVLAIPGILRKQPT